MAPHAGWVFSGMLAVPTQKVLEQTQDLPLKVTIHPLTHREEHALEVQVPLIIENFGEDVELICRDWYQLREYSLVAGKCPDCGKTLAGYFDSRPGTWGPRSYPVRL